MKFKAHDYQKRAIDFIESHPAAGLFLDMGLGKTVITLTAINDLMYDRFEIQKVLVVAPLRVAEDTWSRESEKWDHLKHLRISKILGDKQARIEALQQDADVYVINRENVAWLIDNPEHYGKRWPFDMVVIDELSSFKSSTAQRFKKLRKVRPCFDRIVGLTGTPAANGLMDLWAEIYLLDRGERLGTSISSYRTNYFRPGWSNGYVVYKWQPRREAMQEITDRISDITVSMKASDYLQLPDRIDNTISVTLYREAMDAYQKMERESLLQLGEDQIVALDAAAVMAKLLQLANGFVYDADHKALRIHNAKLEALQEILEAADGPVLVFYSFQADRDELQASIPGARVLKDEADIKAWNEGKIQVLLAHPASVGYGLNLQDGGHIIVWYGLTWSLELYQQANARLHRQGQQKAVLIYHLIARGTADEEVLKKLEEKDTTQKALIEVLKDRKRHYKEA